MLTKRDKNKEFSILLENSPLGVVLTDMQNKFLYVNPSFREMLGYTETEMLSMNIGDLTHSGSIDASKKAIKDAFNGKGPITLEKQYVHKNGSLVDAKTRIAAVFDGNGKPLYQCTNIENITDRKKVDRKLTFQAAHDELTGLINRREFNIRAEQLVQHARRNGQEHILCFMDLDQFKVVNDTCGHTAGDELLRQLSMLLKNSFRKGDTLARLGGDEFGILLEHCDLENATRIVDKIQETVRNFRFTWEGKSHKVSASIGVVLIAENTPDVNALLSDADIACYLAKDMGRNRTHVYQPDDVVQVKRQGEMEWVVRLTKALDENRMRLYAQSIAPIGGSESIHYEVLVRMIDEKSNVVLPGAFLPAAERYNLISKLDRWVVKASLSTLAENPLFLERVDFFSINLSGMSLAEPEFLQFTISQIQECGIEGGKICFEITETAAISNLDLATSFISSLKGLGCLFALDDFGSGLSSFGYLKNLPVDYLKIDGIFVKNIVEDAIDHAMVKSINDIGHVMGIKTIAEFVENDETKALLGEIGVDYAQGYGIGKPTPLAEFMSNALAV